MGCRRSGRQQPGALTAEMPVAMAVANETCVYPLTPPGRAALASLAVCGPGAVALVDSLFRPAGQRRLSDVTANRILFGHWMHGDGEEVVVTVRDPRQVEIHGHGGTAASRAILGSLTAAGAKAGSWQDWVAQQEPRPIPRDAQLALVHARTERTAGILLDQWQGALEGEIQQIIRSLQCDQLDAARQQIDRLLNRSRTGRHLTRPFRVVLAGQPNVGKSSLINAILGYPRAIVNAQPGTTRDVVTGTTAIDGWPVVLSDTAGLREHADELETAGMTLAVGELAAADLVVLVFDHGLPWTAANDNLCGGWPGALVVHNKCDLPGGAGERPAGLRTSATCRRGLAELLNEISLRLVPAVPPRGAGVPFTEAQTAGLRTAQQALLAEDQRGAGDALGRLVYGGQRDVPPGKA